MRTVPGDAPREQRADVREDSSRERGSVAVAARAEPAICASPGRGIGQTALIVAFWGGGGGHTEGMYRNRVGICCSCTYDTAIARQFRGHRTHMDRGHPGKATQKGVK